MSAKFLRNFVLVLGAGGMLFISIRKLRLFIPQIRHESHTRMSPLKPSQMIRVTIKLWPVLSPGNNIQMLLSIILDQDNGARKSF